MSGPECCENPPAPSSGGESGDVHQIASLNSYFSGNIDSKIAVLLISDVHGYGAPKLRKLADKVASAGYYVVVPDLFHGDPMTPEIRIEDWLPNHAPDQGVEFAKPVIQALKEKGITKIGAAGFCWGAKVVVDLAKDIDIQVAALLHPTFVKLDDIKGLGENAKRKLKNTLGGLHLHNMHKCILVKVPMAILGAEFDKLTPAVLIKQFEEALEAKPEVDHFVKIYPGVSHGWTVRYQDEDEVAMKCAKEAHQDLLEWFGNYL